jgi:hypothetical protein
MHAVSRFSIKVFALTRLNSLVRGTGAVVMTIAPSALVPAAAFRFAVFTFLRCASSMLETGHYANYFDTVGLEPGMMPST